ncbi:helix-turn-helix transcriptional regulator [Burkholderia sp. WAC0059]|uniref:helix-turn-helix transcriptional regulator n=1 Tax=Burkholderia sp. WAC0059 TaxID=2066022 RepID=UPI000C7F59B3|nr:helix-turn-helix transcriptional regulator [Burkholderia sp. WAC0059]PLZ02695.1 helix-turn-helix transcriptional regulator [Burkholderia sp. WAC0059]
MDSASSKPQVDRRQLQQIVAGLTEGIVLSDPDGTIAWANETALSIHGVETLADCGGNVAGYQERFTLKYRNNHPLQPEQYPLARVLGGEVFHDMIVEVTKPADDAFRRIHQIRSLVLTDASDEPQSLVLVIQDVTERFTAEERFEKTFNANPAPAVICRISDLRYVKVNQGFLEMTGYARDEIVGRPAYEFDVLEGAERRDQAIGYLNEGRTIPQMESVLHIADGGSKFVIVAGQPIEIGDENCMLFTFMDLEPRRKVEAALRQTEERFSKAFRLAPVPMTVSSLDDMLFLDVNDAFVSATGYEAEEVIARDPSASGLWADRAAFDHFRKTVESAGSIRNVDMKLRTKSGDTLDCLVSAETVTIHERCCLLCVLQDITERKRTESELIAAIETVMQDTSWFSRTVIEKLAEIRHPARADEPSAVLADLSPRELEVLSLICQGCDDAKIAETLHLSRNTVRNYVAAVYSKIGVNRRSAAIIWARDRGIERYSQADTLQRLRRKPRGPGQT